MRRNNLVKLITWVIYMAGVMQLRNSYVSYGESNTDVMLAHSQQCYRDQDMGYLREGKPTALPESNFRKAQRKAQEDQRRQNEIRRKRLLKNADKSRADSWLYFALGIILLLYGKSFSPLIKFLFSNCLNQDPALNQYGYQDHDQQTELEIWLEQCERLGVTEQEWYKKIEAAYQCPITKTVPKRPVHLNIDQRVYDGDAIRTWLDTGPTRTPTGIDINDLKIELVRCRQTEEAILMELKKGLEPYIKAVKQIQTFWRRHRKNKESSEMKPGDSSLRRRRS